MCPINEMPFNAHKKEGFHFIQAIIWINEMSQEIWLERMGNRAQRNAATT